VLFAFDNDLKALAAIWASSVQQSSPVQFSSVQFSENSEAVSYEHVLETCKRTESGTRKKKLGKTI